MSKDLNDLILGIILQAKLMGKKIDQCENDALLIIYIYENNKNKDFLHLNFHKKRNEKSISNINIFKYRNGILIDKMEESISKNFNEFLKGVPKML